MLFKQFGVQEYIVNRVRKEKSALLRNAKLRLSNIPWTIINESKGPKQIDK